MDKDNKDLQQIKDYFDKILESDELIKQADIRTATGENLKQKLLLLGIPINENDTDKTLKEKWHNFKIIDLIRTEAKKQGKTIKSIGEYACMKSTYINKFLGGGCGLPSVDKLQKIGEYLNIDLMQYVETKEALKADNERLQAENKSLKESLKKYQEMAFIYENYEDIEKLKGFVSQNKDIISKLNNL